VVEISTIQKFPQGILKLELTEAPIEVAGEYEGCPVGYPLVNERL
jgi:hypothetical protein